MDDSAVQTRQDGHDILGTFETVVNPFAIKEVPQNFEHLETLIKKPPLYPDILKKLQAQNWFLEPDEGQLIE